MLLLGGPLAQAASVSLLNVSYDPTRELYVKYNADSPATGTPRRGRTCASTSPTAARASRRGRSSTACRPTWSPWRWPTTSSDRRPARQAARRRLAARLPRQQRALHLHDRVPGAQGQPQGHPATGATWSGPGRGGHARTRRPRGGARWNYLAAWAWALHQPGGNDGEGQGLRAAGSTRTCRCWTPARGMPPRPSSSAASATCWWPGRTKRSWPEGGRRPTSWRSCALPEHPGGAAGGAWWTRWSTRHGTTRGGDEYLRSTSTARRRRRSLRRTSIARAIRRWRRSTLPGSRSIAAGHRRRLRRLDQGGEGSLRGRRQLRPDIRREVTRAAHAALASPARRARRPIRNTARANTAGHAAR